jgi:hypothetical protein
MTQYGVRILFRDKNSHTIETTDVEEAQKYLHEIKRAISMKEGNFTMYNKTGEIVYVCNLDNLIHAMVVSVVEENK